MDWKWQKIPKIHGNKFTFACFLCQWQIQPNCWKPKAATVSWNYKAKYKTDFNDWIEMHKPDIKYGIIYCFVFVILFVYHWLDSVKTSPYSCHKPPVSLDCHIEYTATRVCIPLFLCTPSKSIHYGVVDDGCNDRPFVVFVPLLLTCFCGCCKCGGIPHGWIIDSSRLYLVRCILSFWATA